MKDVRGFIMPDNDLGIRFLQWALPKLGYRWEGFRKPRNQVIKRIRHRIGELKLSGGYDDYREYLEIHSQEWETLDRLLNVTISKFFRDRKVWDFLRTQILPAVFQNTSRAITIWSAGCCNGEEPYSCAMIGEQLSISSSASEKITILATDRNPEVLQRAKAGHYPAGALKELTNDEIDQFFHRIEGQDDDYQIDRRIKKMVYFERRDIRKSLPPRKFDLVFCRNLVFTYFAKNEQSKFLDQMKPLLNSGGFLVIGSNEELPDVNWLRRVNNRHPVYHIHEK